METETKELWRKFGLWYQNARENVHKTQEDVSRIAGVHVKTLSRIENGEPTKRSTVVKLAEAVGADKLEALNRAGFDVPTAKKFPDFLYKIDFNAFTPAELKEIESFIRFKLAEKVTLEEINWQAGDTLPGRKIAVSPERERIILGLDTDKKDKAA